MEEYKPEANYSNIDTVGTREQIRANFATRLEDIKDKKVTVDNIDIYTDKVLNDLISLTQDIISEYVKETGLIPSAGKDFEDEAYKYFGISEISSLLHSAQLKAEEMNSVSQFLLNRIIYTDKVIVPPDNSPRILPGNGSIETPTFTPRLKLIIYLLSNHGLSLDNVQVIEGSLNDSMFRQTSYVTIVVPEIDRIIQVCDEDGNSSYVFKLSLMDAETANSMTKKEKLDWITKNKDGGVRVVNRSLWRENMETYIFGESFSEDGVSGITSEVFEVERGELDEWRGFWTDPETSKHWGYRRSIVNKLGKTYIALKGRIDPQNTEMKPLRDFVGRIQDGYCYEDLINKFPELIEGHRVEKEGEWRGFWTDPETSKHWGSGGTLLKKLDVTDWITIMRYIKRGNLKSIDIQDTGGRKTSGYCYEDFLENDSFMDFKTAPEVNEGGEWSGFIVDDSGRHWAPVGVIASKFNTTSSTLDLYIKKLGLVGRNVKTRTKEIQVAYCIENLQEDENFMDFINLPRSDTEGEWRGFFIDEDGRHFGSILQMSKKLNVDRKTIDRVLNKNHIQSIKMKDGKGKPVTGFCIEEVKVVLNK